MLAPIVWIPLLHMSIPEDNSEKIGNHEKRILHWWKTFTGCYFCGIRIKISGSILPHKNQASRRPYGLHGNINGARMNVNGEGKPLLLLRIGRWGRRGYSRPQRGRYDIGSRPKIVWVSWMVGQLIDRMSEWLERTYWNIISRLYTRNKLLDYGNLLPDAVSDF